MKIKLKLLLPAVLILAAVAGAAIAQGTTTDADKKHFKSFYIKAYVVTSDLVEDKPAVGFSGETKYLNGVFSNRETELSSDEFFDRIFKAEKQSVKFDRQILVLTAAENDTAQASVGSKMAAGDDEHTVRKEILINGVELAASVKPVEDEKGEIVSVVFDYDLKNATLLNKEILKIANWDQSGSVNIPIGKFYLVSAKKDLDSKKEKLFFVEVREIVFRKTE